MPFQRRCDDERAHGPHRHGVQHRQNIKDSQQAKVQRGQHGTDHVLWLMYVCQGSGYDLRPAPTDAEPEKKHMPQPHERTCAVCGRVGKRWFTRSPRGEWVCSSASACVARADANMSR